jgi:hypothetical protein
MFQTNNLLGFDQKPSKSNCSINRIITFACFLIKAKQIYKLKTFDMLDYFNEIDDTNYNEETNNSIFQLFNFSLLKSHCSYAQQLSSHSDFKFFKVKFLNNEEKQISDRN